MVDKLHSLTNRGLGLSIKSLAMASAARSLITTLFIVKIGTEVFAKVPGRTSEVPLPRISCERYVTLYGFNLLYKIV